MKLSYMYIYNLCTCEALLNCIFIILEQRSQKGGGEGGGVTWEDQAQRGRGAMGEGGGVTWEDQAQRGRGAMGEGEPGAALPKKKQTTKAERRALQVFTCCRLFLQVCFSKFSQNCGEAPTLLM